MQFVFAECVCFPLQDDKDTSSTKESLDDLFPTEDEEQSQSKALLLFVNVFITDFNISNM